MYHLKQTFKSSKSAGITEQEFGLHIYSLATQEQIKNLLEIQQTYVESGELLFFLRELDEGDSEYAPFTFVVHRICKTQAGAQSLRNEMNVIYDAGLARGSGGTKETTLQEISYDSFVELQQKIGTKYYFAGLAEVLEELED